MCALSAQLAASEPGRNASAAGHSALVLVVTLGHAGLFRLPAAPATNYAVESYIPASFAKRQVFMASLRSPWCASR